MSYIMSLLYKLPPVISAVAFGYGVGMAAPDSAISSMKTAVSGTAEVAQLPVTGNVAAVPHPHGNGAQGLGDSGNALNVRAQRSAGSASMDTKHEPERLAMLRQAAQAPASCDVDRPLASQPPRYLSRQGYEADDVDDLDDAGAEALSKLQLPDLRLSITRRTLKYVRFFARTDRGRGMFETWLSRSGRYQELISRELREWHLPEDLIWVSMIESGFDARVRSPAGAVGLWQFMPATGGVYGLVQNRFVDQRKNPKLATQAAAHHLRDLYMRFGNWDLALAAYNMGYEQLLDAIDRYGTADFNELARQQAIPKETASYVPKIAAAAIIANNLERFGFDKVEIRRPEDVAEIFVPSGTSLRTVAKAAGVSTRTLRNLNPDFLEERVPPGRGDAAVMIPALSMARTQAALPALLQTEPLENDASVLDPVNLLSGREPALNRSRRNSDDSLLSMLPPYKKRRALRDPVDDLEARFDRDDDNDRDDDAPIMVRPRRARSDRETLIYKVGAGDTLIGIARQFAADVEDVARDNDLSPESKLRAGALLKLRVRRDVLKNSGDDEAQEKREADKASGTNGNERKEKAPEGSGERKRSSGKSEHGKARGS